MQLIPNQPRNRLLLLTAVTLLAAAGIVFLLILPLKRQLGSKADRLAEARVTLRNAKRTVQMAESVKDELQQQADRLEIAEQGVARGDVYRWIVNALIGFEERYSLDFGSFEQFAVGDLAVPPRVPYRAATLTVSGVGTYHDVGRFLMAFERKYPLIRLQGLSLEPTTYVETDPDLPGKLTVRMNLLVLVKPSAVTP
jgi:hypothetical protein